MKASIPELEAVAAVARLGGFRAAARELGVSSSALSAAVAGLESRLGVRLFNRTTRSVVLTAAGEQFVTTVAPALAAIDGAIEGVAEHSAAPVGTLKLNMALGAATMLFEPFVAEYLRRYPQMAVEIATNNALVDIIAEGFDAGVRLAETVPPDMIAVPIVPELQMVIVGAPDYLAGRDRPEIPGDLLAHDCIRNRMASGRIYRWELERRGESMAMDIQGRLILDSSSVTLEAVRAGFGLAYIEQRYVVEDLARGRLIQLLSDWTPPYPGLMLYYPGRRHVPAKLRAFIDTIRAVRRADERAGAERVSRPPTG